MSRRRSISTEISIDKAVRRLSNDAALLYTWMIPHAEEDATITADPEELAARVFPNRPKCGPANVAKWLAEIDAQDLVRVVDGTVYFPPKSFYAQQSNVQKDRRRDWHPERTPCKAEQSAENTTEQHASPQNSASPSPSPSPSPTPTEPMSGQPDEAARVFEYWQQRLNHPSAKLTPDRRKKIEARLHDGLTPDRLRRAIDGCARSPHHMGQNDSGTVYDSIELIFRNTDKTEWFADLATRAPTPRTAPNVAKALEIAQRYEGGNG